MLSVLSLLLMARRKHVGLFGHRSSGSLALRRFGLWVGGVAAALLLLLVVAWFQVLAYLQSDSFRLLLADKLREGTAAQSLTLRSKFTIDGDTVRQDGVELAGAGALSSLRADSVNLELNRAALFHRVLHVNKASVESGELVIRSAGAPVPVKKTDKNGKSAASSATSGAASPAPAAPPAEEKKPFFTPRGYELELFECKDADLVWQRGKQSYRLLNSSVSATPDGKGWQLLFENGRLHIPNDYLKEASLKTATVHYGDKGTDLSDCRIMLSPGELRATGHVAPGGKWSANLALNKLDVRRVLEGDWKQRVSGQLFGKLSLTGNAKGLGVAQGFLSMQEGVLEGLPFLSDFPAMDGTYPYRRVELDKAECHISYPYTDEPHRLKQAWLFDKITLNSRDNRLLVRGRVIIGEDGSLSGSLSIGLPEQLFADISGNTLLQTIFNGSGEPGYRWVNINLSGTVEAPEEDLSVRLSTLLKRRPAEVLKQAGDAMKQLLQGAAKEAQPAEQQPVDTLRKAGDAAGDLINSGLNALF